MKNNKREKGDTSNTNGNDFLGDEGRNHYNGKLDDRAKEEPTVPYDAKEVDEKAFLIAKAGQDEDWQEVRKLTKQLNEIHSKTSVNTARLKLKSESEETQKKAYREAKGNGLSDKEAEEVGEKAKKLFLEKAEKATVRATHLGSGGSVKKDGR